MLVSWEHGHLAHVRVRSKQSVLAVLGISDQRSTIEAGKRKIILKTHDSHPRYGVLTTVCNDGLTVMLTLSNVEVIDTTEYSID